MRLSRAAVGCGLLLQALSASSAHAQVRLYQLSGDQSYLGLGSSIAAAGDFDLDGVPDFLVGSHTSYTTHYGRALMVSGRTGVVLRTFASTESDDGFGECVKCVGDLDLDGIPDVIVGAPAAMAHTNWFGGGIVRAYSGRNASLLWAARPPSFGAGNVHGETFGAAIDGVGDIDGDGIPDVAVGNCTDRLSATVLTMSARVLSGRDGSLLRVLTSCACQWGAGGFGLSIAGVGDVDGDGVPDILVGAIHDDSNGRDAGAAFLFSGRTGSILREFRGPTVNCQFGTVAAIRDLNHDGHPDFLVGAQTDRRNGAGAGSVSVYSGADGSLLRVLYGNAGDRFGAFVSGGGDVNGDGVPDFAVGAPGAMVAGLPGGAVRVFSGRDGSLLAELPCEAPYEGVGPCAVLHDLNGDGLDDLVVGTPDASRDGPFSGGARVYLLGHTPPNPYCWWKWNSQNCGSTPFVEGAPSLSVGDGLLVHVGAVLNHTRGFLVWGLARAELPFGGGTLCVQALDHGRVEDSGGDPGSGTDCTGTLAFRFTTNYMRSHGLAAGTRVFCQFVSRDDGFPPPDNVGLSQGLAFTVLP